MVDTMLAQLYESPSSLENTFVQAMSANGILNAVESKTMFRKWWAAVADDVYLCSLHGPLALLRAHLQECLNELRIPDVEAWTHLNFRKKILLEFALPAITNRLGSLSADLQTIENSVADLPLNGADEVINSLIRRRAVQLEEGARSPMAKFEVVQDRISELRMQIAMHKDRMKELHARAKSAPAEPLRREIFDTTFSMQDELARIYSALAPAQSEVRMLEHSVKPFEQLQKEHRSKEKSLQGTLETIPDALHAAISSLNPPLANAILLLWFRELMAAMIEYHLSANREEIIAKLENVWEWYFPQSSLHEVETGS
jgi:hypothetical protein